MGRTNTKKEEARMERLKGLPRSQRLAKTALMKKRDGRVLDAMEKHAMKMTSEYGEVMRLWEVLRVSSAPTTEDGGRSVEEIKESRYEHKYPTVDRLLKIIEPKFDAYVKTPRVSRVMQSMIKYGSNTQLERMLKLLSGAFVANATDAYGHFVVAALIRHAPHTILDRILALIIPSVSSLISHRFGIDVIHAAYSNRLCTKVNRHLLVLAVFKDNLSVMKRWSGYPVLEDVLQQETAQRKRLLPKLFELCDKLVTQKGAVDYPFVQRMVAAYVRYGTKDEVKELCDTLRPHMASLCLTREGAPLVSMAFAIIEPKKRKEVLRTFCENLGSLATGKYSAPIIARLFDLVYDVQLLYKYVVNDVTAHIVQLVNSPFGHQMLLHLVTPSLERKKRFLLPYWFDHNLFSKESNTWNTHTWFTREFVEETIEICSKNATSTHLAVLPSIIESFLRAAADPTVKLDRHHTALIAREVLHVHEVEAAYKKALHLSEENLQLLARLAPAKEKRTRDEAVTELQTPPVQTAKSKAHRTEKKTTAPNAVASSASTNPMNQKKKPSESKLRKKTTHKARSE